jgi:hypothetical protein
VQTRGAGGDGIIGIKNWSGIQWYYESYDLGNEGGTPFAQQNRASTDVSPLFPDAGGRRMVENETTMFWVTLAGAGLIKGSSTALAENPQGVRTEFGVTHPANRYGGGYFVAHPEGNKLYPTAPLTTTFEVICQQPGVCNGFWDRPRGIHVLAVASSQVVFRGLGSQNQLFTPAQARKIDEKMDDGVPTTGKTLAFGDSRACIGILGDLDTAPSFPAYQLQPSATGTNGTNMAFRTKSKACGLSFQILQ